MHEIVLSNQAAKFIKRADTVLAERLINKLEALKREPVGHDSKRIIGRELFRVRVGNYRILYAVQYDQNTIFVEKIDHRERVYE
mgnify:CR=1 FL=1